MQEEYKDIFEYFQATYTVVHRVDMFRVIPIIFQATYTVVHSPNGYFYVCSGFQATYTVVHSNMTH